ncbi:phage tail tape measure protein [Clostridium oceanicum]|uniref:Phage tail tape measure protein domain-containing protein n=1 Tax=Clostridium oceanicum TaxID=1543 RepID=A0ABN1JCA4_9CLOT
MAEKTKKKMKALDKIRAGPSAKLKDNASKKIDRIKSKTDKLNNKKAKIKLEAKDKASRVIGRAQKKINGWIKTGAKKIISIGLAGTVALGGVGIASSIKTFSDFEYGMKTVQATSQASRSDLVKLTDTAKHLGATTAFSAKEAASGMNYLAMAGYKTNDIISSMPGLLNAAAASGEDLASVSDIISDAVTSFGLKASDTSRLSDVMASASANANTNIGLLGESFKYVGATAGAMGYSVEDASIALGLMANAGVKGSMGGTALKNAMVNMASPTDKMQAIMDRYNISVTDCNGKMKSLKSVMDMLREKMGGLDKATQSAAASHLFGKEAMSGMLSIINASPQDYDKLTSAIYNAKGASEKMANTKLDSLSGQWTILKSAVEGMQIELGERLAPYAKQFVSWLTAKMPQITDKIVKFVDYISKNTTKIKALAKSIAGIGAASIGFSVGNKIGSTISGISKFSKIFKGAKVAEGTAKAASGLKKFGLLAKILPAVLSPAGLAIAATATVAGTAYVANSNLMKRSISDTTEELGPMEKIMNVLNGRIHKSKAEMQGMGLIYEDFGKNIGSGFKKRVEESTRSIRDFQLYLNEINLDGKIDKNESNEFDRKVNEMCNSAIKTIQSKKDETQKAFRDLFMDDGKMSASEQSTLDYFNKKYDVQVGSEKKLQEQIYNVKKEAIAKHGKLLDEDIKKIKEYQDQMTKIQLEAVGGNADEINYAKNKFKARAQGLDIKDASTLLKESAKKRDDSIVEIKAKYDTYIDKLKSELENPKLDAAKRGHLESTLNELEKAEAGKIKSQLKLHNENLNTLYSYNPNLKGKLNKYTGAELTGEDIDSQGALQKMRESYKGLEQITRSGNYRIYDSNSKMWQNLQAVVDKNTGEITGLYNIRTGECGGYTDQLSSKVKELSRSHTDLNMNATQALNLLNQAYVDAKGRIVTSAGEVIANLDNVTRGANGTTNGILTLNGTPIRISSNADGTINNMDQVRGAVNNIPNSKNIQTSSNADKTKSKTDNLTSSVNNIPQSKTITITTIFKKVFKWIGEKAANLSRNVGPAMPLIPGTASGTSQFKGGLSTVDEKGWELSDRPVSIIGQHRGNPLTYMSRGTKILNHMQSVRDMKAEVDRQVNSSISKQPPQQQIQYKVVQPQQQLQVAGMGNVNLGGINVNIQDNGDVDKIVQEAMNDFGYKLKEALTNIKK